jgi:hypothetical protein
MLPTTAAVALSIAIKAEVIDVVRPLSEFVPVVSAVLAYVSSGVITLVRAALMAVISDPNKRLVATLRSVTVRATILQNLPLAVLLKTVATTCSRAVTVTLSSSKTFTKAVTEADVRTVDIPATSASTDTTAVANALTIKPSSTFTAALTVVETDEARSAETEAIISVYHNKKQL